MRLKKIGHLAVRVTDPERSKAFYTNILGFRVAEQDPVHGGIFMTLGDDFHNLDLTPVASTADAKLPDRNSLGVAHVAFQVASYQDLRDAYETLLKNGVTIDHATDHVQQRSLYFADPDGNRLEIYYEMPDALKIYPEGREDRNDDLPIGKQGDPLPAWLQEEWPPKEAYANVR